MLNKSLSTILPLVFCAAFFLPACSDSAQQNHAQEHSPSEHSSSAHDEHAAETVEKGSHNGRLLRDKNFTLELAIFETGVPPEYRAWAYDNDKPVPVSDIKLKVFLTRLGNKVDTIGFTPQGGSSDTAGFLRGDSVIYEPHSFLVKVEASYNGVMHQWEYASLEGRTSIEPHVVKALEISTELAGPARLQETVEAYGKVSNDPARKREIRARFDGVITAVHVQTAETVRAGQALFTVESNESLKPYTINAPIGGKITEQHGMTGEQTSGEILATIVDNTAVVVDLAIFPAQLGQVKPGAEVTVHYQDKKIPAAIAYLATTVNSNQSVNARVRLAESIPLGTLLKADIVVAEYDVPLAVKRVGLQAFRDFTVVYAQVGDEFEVRMLELGRSAGEWVEVLGGLEAGTRYVTENSYVVKGDIEKSGASHDH